MFIYIHIPQIKVKEKLVVRKDMDVNEHDYPTLHLDTN
jgi:hypothetical protein